MSGNRKADEDTKITEIGHGREIRGTPWFEEMIEGSELGRMRRRRRGRTGADGKTKVELEVMEFGGDDGEGGLIVGEKRKLDRVGEGDDLVMRSG